jgi:hypothetical protein
MANTILTPDMITREALDILHQKAVFIGSINRQYDDRFAQSGAKIGESLRIKMPNVYEVTDGAVLNVQDTTQESQTLTVATRKHVGLSFTAQELTMKLDEFSKQILDPAVSILAAKMEADALSMIKDVCCIVDQDATAFTYDTLLAGREVLNDNLAPMDNQRTALLSSRHSRKIAKDIVNLANPNAAAGGTFREGFLAHASGFDIMESSMIGKHTTGTSAKTTGYTVNGTTEGADGSVTLQTGTATFLKGDVLTFAGCYRVHPETKVSTGVLQPFVVTEDYAGGAGDIKVYPKIITSGAKQNVSAYPDNGGAVVKVGAGANELLDNSLVYHKDAFTIVTADLRMPQGVDFASRKVKDGISMRIVQDYDIVNDKFPCRIDVLYGYKTLRPELACRLHADG